MGHLLNVSPQTVGSTVGIGLNETCTLCKYLPDSSYPVAVYSEAIENMKKCRRLIIEASGHIIKHTIVMGDFNVRLPHHPPYVGNLGHEWGTGQYLERHIVD